MYINLKMHRSSVSLVTSICYYETILSQYYHNMPNKGAGRDSKEVKADVLGFPTVVSD